MAIYKDKLAPQGAVVMHVSNRHLELSSVVVGIADATISRAGSTARIRARQRIHLLDLGRGLRARGGRRRQARLVDQWALTEADEDQRVWTDDYSTCSARCIAGCAMAKQ